MAKSKYKKTFPKLAEGYAREGLSDKQIAKNLGIGKDTFYQYIKRYPDFADALKKGKEPVDLEVENALLKRALGYTVDETKTVVKIVDGKETKEIHKTEKHIAGDTTAQIFWLKNRKPKQWRDKREVEAEISGGLKMEINYVENKKGGTDDSDS